MIRPLRRRHLRLTVLLAVILPVMLGLAFRARREPPRGELPREILSAPVATTESPGPP